MNYDMELIIYNKKTYPNRTFYGKEPYIRFSRSNNVSFTRSTMEVLNISENMGIQFIQDAKKPKDWYVMILPDGFILRKGKSGLLFSFKKLVENIRESLHLPPGKFALRVCKEPVFEGENVMHALLTSNPL
jgi:hypothetical protein